MVNNKNRQKIGDIQELLRNICHMSDACGKCTECRRCVMHLPWALLVRHRLFILSVPSPFFLRLSVASEEKWIRERVVEALGIHNEYVTWFFPHCCPTARLYIFLAKRLVQVFAVSALVPHSNSWFIHEVRLANSYIYLHTAICQQNEE